MVGASGYVARNAIAHLRERGHVVETVGRTNADHALDLANVGPAQSADLAGAAQLDVSYINPGDTVVFTAAVSSPDLCEREFDKCWQVNVEGTSRYIQAALDRGAKVAFLSSDAVFASAPDVVYDESSEMAPRFPYGKMKAAIERTFERNAAFKALRLSYVFSATDKFTSYLVKCLRAHEAPEIFHPYYRSSIALADVCRTITWLVENWDDFPHSKLNLAGTELVSRVRMADEFGVVFPDALDYSIARPDPAFYECRPAVTQMRSLHLYRLGIIQERCFSESYAAELKG